MYEKMAPKLPPPLTRKNFTVDELKISNANSLPAKNSVGRHRGLEVVDSVQGLSQKSSCRQMLIISPSGR
jgi:hypothetical protein